MTFRSELPEMSFYTFGTMGLTDKGNPAHVKVARAAMDAGVWFHTSEAYPGVSETLKAAFAEDPGRVPRLIVKVDGKGADLMRSTVERQVRDLGVDGLDIAQVCGNPDVDGGLREGNALHETMCDLKDRGLVGCYVLEIFHGFSDNLMAAVEDDMFDGYIFYYNVVNREVSDGMFDLLERKQANLLSLRTVGGGIGKAGVPAARLEALDDLYRRSGCASQLEFYVRFLRSVPRVRTTVGGTTSIEHLNAFLRAARDERPLAPEIVEGIRALHREWFAVKGLG